MENKKQPTKRDSEALAYHRGYEHAAREYAENYDSKYKENGRLYKHYINGYLAARKKFFEDTQVERPENAVFTEKFPEKPSDFINIGHSVCTTHAVNSVR